MPLPDWQLFDRIRAYLRRANIFRQEGLFQDQSQPDRILSGGDVIEFSKTAGLLEQTNLQINRLERYKDYDMMDEVGEITLALDIYADEACLVGETRVPLLDGTCPTIKELADKGIDHKFWVYSYDLIKDKYVPAEAHAARITGRNVKVIKVILDDGTTIKCTSDHLFLTKAGQYVRAKDLKANDSLMPLYKKVRYRSKDHKWYNNKPYSTCSEYAFLFDGERFTTIHRWVMNEVLGLNPQVIHHKDFNGINNIPNNLESMTNEEHKKLHQKLGVDNPSFNIIKLSEIREKLQNWQGSSLTREDIFKLCDIGERVLYRVLRENNLTWHEFKHDYHKCICGAQLSGIRTVCDACKKQYNAQLHQSKKTDCLYMMRRILNKRRYYQQNEAVTYKTCENCGIQKTINNFRRSNCSYSPYCDDCRPSVCSRRYLQKSFANHKVVSVETCDELQDVYDIEVPQYHNFAVGSDQSWVIVHNSLIDPERKHAIVVKSRSKKMAQVVEDLLYNVLLIDNHVRPMIRYLCKYGDFASEIVPTKNRDGISSLRFINIYNFTRVQTKHGDLVGFYYQDPNTLTPYFLHPWQVMHMRLTSFEQMYNPYGRSILDGSRKDFKRLRMMEDAALIYRITRAPEKRIFSIPIGNIPANQIHMYITEIARQFKKHKFVDPATGQVNERYSPLIQEDDFFLPKRPDGSGPEITTLPGAQNLDQIEDIMYFKKKMISGTKIPFSRVGIGEQAGSDGKSLSSVSPEFAKAVQWIQRECTIGLKKVVIVHLALQGYSIEEIKDFDLNMTASSAIDELYRIETWNTRADIIRSLKESGLFPPDWILRRFTDMTDDEIDQLESDQEEAAKKAAESGQPKGPDELGMDGGLGGLGGLGLEDVKDDDERLLQEYDEFKNRTRSRRILLDDMQQTPVAWYVNTNEMDNFPKTDEDGEDTTVLVKSIIEDIDGVKKEFRDLLVESENNSDGETGEIKESDLP